MFGLVLIYITSILGVAFLLCGLVYLGWGKGTKEERYYFTLCLLFGTLLIALTLHYLL